MNDGDEGERNVSRGERIAQAVIAAIIFACVIGACVLALLASGSN